MKKINWKIVYVITLRGMLSLLLIIGVALIPAAIIFSRPKANNYIEKHTVAQSILELWNIDTFEGGTASKSSFLSSIAICFEKENRGSYIMVKNKTVDECMLALSQGQYPALFSFGLQAGKKLFNYLNELSFSPSINKIFLDSAKLDNKLFASPWCYGIYSLISTNLVANDRELSSIATTSGEQKQLKNGKVKTTYSIVFGEKYSKPTSAYMANFGTMVNIQNAYDTNNFGKSAYDAYCDFVENKAKILLGSQRDIVRLENRALSGRIQDVVYQHLGIYTDLVQYIGICNLASKEEIEISNSFIKFLTSIDNLQMLSKIGMFAPIDNQNLYFDGIYKDMQIAANNITIVPKLF